MADVLAGPTQALHLRSTPRAAPPLPGERRREAARSAPVWPSSSCACAKDLAGHGPRTECVADAGSLHGSGRGEALHRLRPSWYRSEKLGWALAGIGAPIQTGIHTYGPPVYPGGNLSGSARVATAAAFKRLPVLAKRIFHRGRARQSSAAAYLKSHFPHIDILRWPELR